MAIEELLDEAKMLKGSIHEVKIRKRNKGET